jgi:hypothetical protein
MNWPWATMGWRSKFSLYKLRLWLTYWEATRLGACDGVHRSFSMLKREMVPDLSRANISKWNIPGDEKEI